MRGKLLFCSLFYVLFNKTRRWRTKQNEWASSSHTKWIYHLFIAMTDPDKNDDYGRRSCSLLVYGSMERHWNWKLNENLFQNRSLLRPVVVITMKWLIYCLIYGLVVCSAEKESSHKPPNFILIVTDDQDVVLNGLVWRFSWIHGMFCNYFLPGADEKRSESTC